MYYFGNSTLIFFSCWPLCWGQNNKRIMEGHSGQKCNWIATAIPLDRTTCYLFVSCMPFNCAFMPFDRTRLSIAPSIRSYLTFGRIPHSSVPSILSYSPFDCIEHSVVLPIRSYRAFGHTPHSIVP